MDLCWIGKEKGLGHTDCPGLRVCVGQDIVPIGDRETQTLAGVQLRLRLCLLPSVTKGPWK